MVQRTSFLYFWLHCQTVRLHFSGECQTFEPYHPPQSPHLILPESRWTPGNRDLAVCKALSLAPCAFLGNGPAFFLREARHDGQQDFAFTVEGPDAFLFKIDLDAVFLQLPDGGQGVDRVPCKAADGLGDDQVSLARLFDTIYDEPKKCTRPKNRVHLLR